MEKRYVQIIGPQHVLDHLEEDIPSIEVFRIRVWLAFLALMLFRRLIFRKR